MKKIYTWANKPATRNLTVADLKANKGKKKLSQVSVNSAEESRAALDANIDLIICGCENVQEVRNGNDTLFLTAGIGLPNYPTESDILRAAFRALEQGADAVGTPRSMSIVSMLAREEIPVMGHLGLVPRKSTWVGGLRAVGKTADEAFELFERFRRLEDAGAFSVEGEVIPEKVMAEITRKSNLITVSLGSGQGADVIYLFMQDICGESENPPRHARSYGNLLNLKQTIYKERVKALCAFREDIFSGQFPGKRETVQIEENEFETFLELMEKVNNV